MPERWNAAASAFSRAGSRHVLLHRYRTNRAMQSERCGRARFRNLADEVVAGDVVARIEPPKIAAHLREFRLAITFERTLRLVTRPLLPFLRNARGKVAAASAVARARISRSVAAL